MRRTVCIIDDDMVSQFATRYCIQQYQEDFDIITCASGEEGLSMCVNMLETENVLPDIIFLDLVMDGMDGWAFLDNMQHLFKGQSLPKVYVLSAFTNVKDRSIAKEHKLVSGHIDKPLSRNLLDGIFAQ